MKIFDKTPYRNEKGEIDIVGRVRGSLSHGLSWYARIQAQDVVIAIMDKALGEKYSLLRNVTIYDTDIELPLVLVGPQGIFLINVVHERGVYRAKDDEWGTVSGEKFAPAAINQVKRALKLGRVLQVYLERAGFKDLLIDPILMSADPGTHIESTRPAVRIIMSDALERFAISMTQGRAVLGFESVNRIVNMILNGPHKKAEPVPPVASTQATPANSGPTDAFSLGPDQPESGAFSYSFDDKLSAYQAGPPQDTGSQQGGYQDRNQQDTGFQVFDSGNEVFQDEKKPPFDESLPSAPAFENAQPEAQPKSKSRATAPAKKKGLFGLTTAQLGILIGIFLFWLCGMAVFAGYIYLNLNG